MDIKEMQSVLLTKGLRVAEDDPLFAVVVLAEMAVKDASKKHLDQLNAALLTLQKFQTEMRCMGDALLSASEILTIGRQFLSGENEQILEDVGAIKGTIETISRQVSVRLGSDKERLNKLIEDLNTSLSDIVKSINGPKSILHSRNEAFLIERVKEITASVQQLKDIEGLLRSAARERLDTLAQERLDSLISPVVQQMSDQVRRLTEKDTYAMRFMQKTNETQEKTARSIWIMCVATGLMGVMTGFLLRSVLVS